MLIFRDMGRGRPPNGAVATTPRWLPDCGTGNSGKCASLLPTGEIVPEVHPLPHFLRNTFVEDLRALRPLPMRGRPAWKFLSDGSRVHLEGEMQA